MVAVVVALALSFGTSGGKTAGEREREEEVVLVWFAFQQKSIACCCARASKLLLVFYNIMLNGLWMDGCTERRRIKVGNEYV